MLRLTILSNNKSITAMIGENGIVNPNDLKKSTDAFVLTLNAGSVGGQTSSTIATNVKATEKARAILGQVNNQ